MNDKIIIILINLIGIFLRLFLLDERPFHHDEGLYSLYGYYWAIDPSKLYYQYNPLLHGPLLFWILSKFFILFGDSNFTARLPSVIIGQLLVNTPLIFQKYLSKITILILLTVINFSPLLVYYSRFVGHDLLMLLLMSLTLYAVFGEENYLKNHLRWPLLFISISLQMCVKLNFYLHLVFVITFIFLFYVLKIIGFTKLNLNLIPLVEDFKRTNCKNFLIYKLAISISLGILVYVFFYTSGFMYESGILDGLYRKSFSYWLNQHNIERVKGPFIFQTLILSFYEYPLILAFFVYLITFIKKMNKTWFWFLMINFIFLMIITFSYEFLTQFSLFQDLIKFFKLKIPLDFFVCFSLIVLGLVTTLYHFKFDSLAKTFWGFWFYSNIFTYSFVGEKVPWLSVYIFVSAILYLAFYFENEWKENRAIEIIFWVLWSGIFSIINLFLLSFNILNESIFPQLFMQFFVIIIIALTSGYLSLVMINFLQNIKFDLDLFRNIKNFTSFVESESNQNEFINCNRRKIYFFIILILTSYICFSFQISLTLGGSEKELISQVHTTKNFSDIIESLIKKLKIPDQAKEFKLLVLDDSIWPTSWYMRDVKGFQFVSPSDFDNSLKKIDFFIGNIHQKEMVEKTFTTIEIPLRGWWVPNYYKLTPINLFLGIYFRKPWNESGYHKVIYGVKN
jgi:uncharacterized protein (TIGR03663 family)